MNGHDAAAAIAASNPGFRLGEFPQPLTGAAITRMQLIRAQKPGGEVLGYLQHDQLTWFEQLYRMLPPPGMYAATPSKPVQFTLGAFRVPLNQVLVVLDYSFDIYRFSGLAAGDFIPFEPNRLPTQVGWDITVDANRQHALNYQILPQRESQNAQGFPGSTVNTPAAEWQFEQMRAQQFQQAAGPAASLMPQRRHRNGLVKVANNYVARSAQALRVSCSVLNEVPVPIGFFEANVMGLLMAQNVYDQYQKANIAIGDAFQNLIPGAP